EARLTDRGDDQIQERSHSRAFNARDVASVSSALVSGAGSTSSPVMWLSVTLNAGFEYVETLPRRAQGLEVLDYLASQWPHSSREAWSQRIDEGRVTLDGA